MSKQRLELQLLLPTVPDTGDRCVGRLTELLQSKTGIDNAHALMPSDDSSGQICIHYDPAVVSTGEVRTLAMVSEAETRVSPTQKFTKRFEGYFVPSVIAFVVLLLFAPLVIDEAFSVSFYRAMAVLVTASPCALAIATPSAVLSGVVRAARGGILIKGGGPLESLGQLDSIAFDKTGTLTESEPRMTDVRLANGVEKFELPRIAIAVESLSNHPLAKAVVRDGRKKLGDGEMGRWGDGEMGSGRDKSVPDATNLKSITGRGIQADVEGQLAHVGKDDLFGEVDGSPLPDSIRRTIQSLEAEGRTTMIVRHGDRYLGVIGLMDTPREAAKRTIARLRELGITRMIMMSDNLDHLPLAIGLSRATRRLIRQNLWMSLGMVASVFLQKRSAKGADGPRRISADFGSPRTIFHQIMGHGRHAWKNLDPGVGARFRQMNPN